MTDFYQKIRLYTDFVTENSMEISIEVLLSSATLTGVALILLSENMNSESSV